MTLIITLSNQKGGVGKTTTGLNLAAVLSSVNTSTRSATDTAPILYVDTDKQASGSIVVAEMAEAAAASTGLSRGTVLNGRDLRTGEPIGLPFDFLKVTDPGDIAQIPEIANNYRHTFVDTAGSFDDVSRSEAAIAVADYVLVPMLAEKMSRPPTQRTIDTMVRPHLGERFGVAIVNYEARNGYNDLIETAEWLEASGYRMLNTPVRSWRHVARNAICTVGPRTRAVLECQSDFQALAIELTQEA